MLINDILLASQSSLEDKTVSDLVIGLSLISCQLSSGEVGVSYVLRENLPSGCSVFSFSKEIIGMSAAKAAELAVTGEDDIARSIGTCVLVAASQSIDIPNDDKKDMPFNVEFSKNDTVGMIGLIRPVANMLKDMVKEVIVFDKGLEMRGGHPLLKPVSEEKNLLPKCDVVLLSGTTTINGTVDSLLNMCDSSREIVLVGPSSPMYANGYKNTKITHVAGSWWKNDQKEEIFKRVSLGGGIPNLQPYMIKKTAIINQMNV